MSDPLHVLISLHKGYGIGDACQMSVVLQHVKKYRPNWIVDYQAEDGKYQVGHGICNNTFAYNRPYRQPHYDAEILLTLYDKWWGWNDRPNTHVSSCLREHFAMDWDSECGRYQVNLTHECKTGAEYAVSKLWCNNIVTNERRAVAIHYQGDTCPDSKNLSHTQAADICDLVYKQGRVPLIIDWRNQSPVASEPGVSTTGRDHFSKWWGNNIRMNCAVISQCEAFIGIDSGPAKCASATDTPSLVVWTGHHPAQFHDPAPNTTHLVPVGYHNIQPVCNNPEVVKWFEDHYEFWVYNIDPLESIKNWLKEVFK